MRAAGSAIGPFVFVKRVQRRFTGDVTIKSDNSAYIEETLSAKEAAEVKVTGRVRWIGRLI